MILVVCSAGHVLVAVKEAIESIRGTAKILDPAAGDAFRQALGCQAIVYVPAPRLLDGAGSLDLAQARDVILAAHAPGIEHVVVVEPSGGGWDEDARVLGRDRIPCTIVRCAGLLDELADAANLHAAASVWLPRGSEVELATRAALVRTLRAALYRDDLRGTVVTVAPERLDAVEALRRAAAIAGARVRVRAAGPRVSSALRKLYWWMGLVPAELVAVCNRLGHGGRAPAARRV